jgi:hypothetical protein
MPPAGQQPPFQVCSTHCAAHSDTCLALLQAGCQVVNTYSLALAQACCKNTSTLAADKTGRALPATVRHSSSTIHTTRGWHLARFHAHQLHSHSWLLNPSHPVSLCPRHPASDPIAGSQPWTETGLLIPLPPCLHSQLVGWTLKECGH